MNSIVDGYATHYDRAGSGKIILFLHGWGDNLDTFTKLMTLFKAHYDVVSVDLPGFGKTDTPREPFTLTSYAKFLRSFLDKLNIEQPYCVIGHSNGGAIAIKALALGEIKPQKLVLLASSGKRSPYSAKNKLVRLAAKIAKVPTLLLPYGIQKSIKKKAYAKLGSDLFVAEHLQETFKKVVSEDVTEDTHLINADTLLVYGELDTATPVAYGEKFASHIKHSQLKIVHGADHFFHKTHHDEVAKILTEFLK